MCQGKVADFLKPFHLQFKRSLSCCLAAFINADGSNLIAADMQVFAVRHSLQRIFIQIELKVVCGRIGRTKLPVTCRVLTQFPMVFQYISCMSQSLYQRSYFNVPFLCIPAYGPHFLLAQGIGRTDFRMPGESKFVVNLPYDGIYLVARQFVYRAIIIFGAVQVVLVVEMDGTVTNLRIICYPHLRNYKVEVTAVFHQLLQCLASIKKAGTCSGRNGDSIFPDFQQITFLRFRRTLVSQAQDDALPGIAKLRQASCQRPKNRHGKLTLSDNKG